MSSFSLYDDGASVWDTGDSVGPEERAFIRAIVNRFQQPKQRTNLIWAVAEEYSEAFSKARITNIAAEIRLADELSRPIAAHQHSGLTFDFEEDPNIDLFAIQYNDPLLPDSFHKSLAALFEQAAGDYSLIMAERDGHGLAPEDQIRQLNWAAATAGASVMVYQWDIETTPLEQLSQCGFLAHFMEDHLTLGMKPAPELGTLGTRFFLADPGKAYLGYTVPGAAEAGISNLPPGDWDLEWMDAVSGQRVTETDSRLPRWGIQYGDPGRTRAGVRFRRSAVWGRVTHVRNRRSRLRGPPGQGLPHDPVPGPSRTGWGGLLPG